MLYVAEERTAGGRLFHALGPAMANARSELYKRMVVLFQGTTINNRELEITQRVNSSAVNLVSEMTCYLSCGTVALLLICYNL